MSPAVEGSEKRYKSVKMTQCSCLLLKIVMILKFLISGPSKARSECWVPLGSWGLSISLHDIKLLFLAPHMPHDPGTPGWVLHPTMYWELVVGTVPWQLAQCQGFRARICTLALHVFGLSTGYCSLLVVQCALACGIVCQILAAA